MLRRLRPWQWVRGGILAVLAIVAAVLTVVDPHPGADRDPGAPLQPASHSAWTQLPSANDNCVDAQPGNAMRVLVGGDSPDECAGGGVWTPAQQAVFVGTGVAPSGR